ncbi:MAG: hypothetical protein JWN72_608 [Thermoleophilia bacterium]|nr:hypothetical protein [Thermoleophilia bacterium]
MLVAAATAALLATLVVAPGGALSFSIEKQNVGLDNKFVMSPAAERIVTTEAESGDLIGPGMTVKRQVIITNRTKTTTSFTLSLAQVVGSRDGSIAEVRHGVVQGAAAWATIERPTFTLKSGEQAIDTVTIRIPEKVTPGSKSFAVVATLSGSTAQVQGAGVATQFEQDAIYTVELPGDAPVKGKLTKAEVTSAQKGVAAAAEGDKPPVNSRFYVGPGIAGKHRLTLTTEYVNEGERLLRPSGRVTVKDVFGRTAGRYEIPPFTVYPDGAADGQVELRGLPSLGLFTATVELTTDVGSQKTQLQRFVLVPKWLLAVLAAAFLYVVYRLTRWLLARRDERLYGSALGDDTSATTEADVDGEDYEEWPADDDAGFSSAADR